MIALRSAMFGIKGGEEMTLNGLFGGVPAADNTIDIVDNSSTFIRRANIFARSITCTEVTSFVGGTTLGIEAYENVYDALVEVNFPKLTKIMNRAFFYRRKLQTVRMPSLVDISDFVYIFYDCISLQNVYMNSLTSDTVFATSSSPGGFPFGAPNTCVFHFADGDFDGNKNPV